MIQESMLPLACRAKFKGILVTTRDWSDIAVGTQIQSVVGYIYTVGETRHETIRNKCVAMLKNRINDETMHREIFDAQVQKMKDVDDDDEFEDAIPLKRKKSTSPSRSERHHGIRKLEKQISGL
jgi:hypothetical protein